MSKFHELNAPRVEKMLKMLDTIETSARSNKATDELEELLHPLVERIAPPDIRKEVTAEDPDHEVMSRERLDYSIACSKVDRAVKAAQKIQTQLEALSKTIPTGEHACE